MEPSCPGTRARWPASSRPAWQPGPRGRPPDAVRGPTLSKRAGPSQQARLRLLAAASGSCRHGPRVWAGSAWGSGEPLPPAPAMPESLSNRRRRQHHTGCGSEAGARFGASWGFRGVPRACQLSALSPRSASGSVRAGAQRLRALPTLPAWAGPVPQGASALGSGGGILPSRTALPGARAGGVGSGHAWHSNPPRILAGATSPVSAE